MKKSTGIVRRVDELGRIVIPKEIRDEFNIYEKDPIKISVSGSSIILEKYKGKACKKCLTKCEDRDKFCRNCGEEIK